VVDRPIPRLGVAWPACGNVIRQSCHMTKYGIATSGNPVSSACKIQFRFAPSTVDSTASQLTVVDYRVTRAIVLRNS